MFVFEKKWIFHNEDLPFNIASLSKEEKWEWVKRHREFITTEVIIATNEEAGITLKYEREPRFNGSAYDDKWMIQDNMFHTEQGFFTVEFKAELPKKIKQLSRACAENNRFNACIYYKSENMFVRNRYDENFYGKDFHEYFKQLEIFLLNHPKIRLSEDEKEDLLESFNRFRSRMSLPIEKLAGYSKKLTDNLFIDVKLPFYADYFSNKKLYESKERYTYLTSSQENIELTQEVKDLWQTSFPDVDMIVLRIRVNLMIEKKMPQLDSRVNMQEHIKMFIFILKTLTTQNNSLKSAFVKFDRHLESLSFLRMACEQGILMTEEIESWLRRSRLNEKYKHDFSELLTAGYPFHAAIKVEASAWKILHDILISYPGQEAILMKLNPVEHYWKVLRRLLTSFGEEHGSLLEGAVTYLNTLSESALFLLNREFYSLGQALFSLNENILVYQFFSSRMRVKQDVDRYADSLLYCLYDPTYRDGSDASLLEISIECKNKDNLYSLIKKCGFIEARISGDLERQQYREKYLRQIIHALQAEVLLKESEVWVADYLTIFYSSRLLDFYQYRNCTAALKTGDHESILPTIESSFFTVWEEIRDKTISTIRKKYPHNAEMEKVIDSFSMHLDELSTSLEKKKIICLFRVLDECLRIEQDFNENDLGRLFQLASSLFLERDGAQFSNAILLQNWEKDDYYLSHYCELLELIKSLADVNEKALVDIIKNYPHPSLPYLIHELSLAILNEKNEENKKNKQFEFRPSEAPHFWRKEGASGSSSNQPSHT